MSEYIMNPKTASQFRVFGKTEQLVCGARFWLDEAEIQGDSCTYLGFRIRIQMRDDFPQPISFPHVVAVQFPEMDFTKEAKDYVSWTGGWMIKLPISKTHRIKQTIEKNGLIGQMYDMWKAALVGIEWEVSREQFMEEVFGEIEKGLDQGVVVVDKSKILQFVSPLLASCTPLDEAQSL